MIATLCDQKLQVLGTCALCTASAQRSEVRTREYNYNITSQLGLAATRTLVRLGPGVSALHVALWTTLDL